MDLTTATRFKTYYFDSTSVTAYDTLLGYLVTAISAQVEDYLDRYAETTARTVYLDVSKDQQLFSLRGYPVTTVTTVANDVYWDFAASSALDSSDYTVLGDDGLLRVPRYTLSEGPKALKVTYTGGMAVDAATFYATYPQIELAVWAQVGFVFQRRKFLSDTSSAVSGSSVSFQTPDLLPEVLRLLKPHRRTVGF